MGGMLVVVGEGGVSAWLDSALKCIVAVGYGVGADNLVRTVKVYRVEGPGNTRILIGENGEVAIQGETRTLFLNFGDRARAEEFLAQRLSQYPSDVIKSFEVPESTLSRISANAIPESLAGSLPGRALLVDATKAADQFGLRTTQNDELVQDRIQRSGRIG